MTHSFRRALPVLPGFWRTLSTGFALLAFSKAATVAQEEKPPEYPGSPGTTQTDEPCDCEVWCALFVAFNPGSEKAKEAEAAATDVAEGEADVEGDPAVAEQKALYDQLAKAFPKHVGFEMIGESREPILKEYECWVVPTDKLFIKIDSLGEDPAGQGGAHVHLQIWHGKDVLLKSDVILRENPIFFVGPKWGDDRLILALRLLEKTPPETVAEN